MMRWALAGLLLAISSPLAAGQTAIGYQILEDFEGRPLGPASINFCDVNDQALDCLGTLSGGSVALETLAFPAYSQSHVYTGTLITLDIADNFNYSWPAVAARVSGSAPIRLRAWKYDYDLADDVLIANILTGGNDLNTLLSFGSDFSLQNLTLVEYSSAEEFAIDDFRLGLPDVGPGIPEPASWTMLIAGLGLTGAAMRRRGKGRSSAFDLVSNTRHTAMPA